MPRFEFTVAGAPASYQVRNRARLRAWQQSVRAAALAVWPAQQTPFVGHLRITVVYYHEGAEVRIDNDNLLKPIQDALNGLVYDDDRQITDTVIRKTTIDGQFMLRGISPTLAAAFSQGVQFLYVRVDDAPDHAELLK